jgi:hypothetical protein
MPHTTAEMLQVVQLLMVTAQAVKLLVLPQLTVMTTLHLFASHQSMVKFQMVTAQAAKVLVLTLTSATTKAHISVRLLLRVIYQTWTDLYVKTHSVLM